MRMLIFYYKDMLTELFFAVYGFSPGTGLYIFQNIGWRMTGNANGNFKLVTITQFTKLERNGCFIISGR